MDVPFTCNGYRVVENLSMTVNGEPIKDKRTWKERLFSLPWNPFKTHNITIPQIPSTEVIMFENSMIMHPEIASKLRDALEKDKETEIWNPPAGTKRGKIKRLI